jgi:protease IV
MNKIIKVLIFLGILWVISYALAGIILGQNIISSGDDIVVIPIKSMITLDGDNSLLRQTTSGIDIVAKIEKANKDPSVKGIVLDINSPGGTVLGSKTVADAVKKVDKPIVAVISESGTSGAYWIASQSDLIIADELSIIGSIGVIGSYLDFSGFLGDHNITYNRLVTGDYKDMNSPLKPMSTEEKLLVEGKLNKIHEFFVSEVATGRNMEISEINKLAEGQFFLGMEGIDNGLIDEIGDKNYAINRTKKMANLTNGHVEEYKEEEGLFSQLKEYTTYSSFYIGQGIGSVLVSGKVGNNWEIKT